MEHTEATGGEKKKGSLGRTRHKRRRRSEEHDMTAQAFDPAKLVELAPMSKERFERMSHAELVDAVMGLLTTHSEVKAERDVLRLRKCRIDLGSFCSDTVPEFEPTAEWWPPGLRSCDGAAGVTIRIRIDRNVWLLPPA